MQCDVCKTNQAEVFLTQIVEGKIQKVNLCKSCSKERGVDDPTGFALTELLTGLGTSTQQAEKTGGAASGGEGRPEPAQKCPVCGFTQADFKKTGRLGCSECYRTFSESLGNLLKAMHKGTAHTGKVPAQMARAHELNERVRGLREDLQRAVLEENYEDAASLRDQIQRLTNQSDH
jgi:protein arginine kinase activator